MGRFWFLVFIVFLSFSIASCKTNIPSIQSYIVRVQNDLKPSKYSNVKHWYKSLVSSNLIASENPTINNAQTQDNLVLHVYDTVFHGFSTRLTLQQVEELKTRPEVLSVFPDRLFQVQTTRTPEFLGIVDTSSVTNGILKESDFGSNVIIGILDSGICPERPNFHDEDLGPVPSRWKGECEAGDNFPKTLCNKKLIGARYHGFDPEVDSARDTIGHGTHTASTAAGRHVSNASFLGFAKGEAVGVAPKARIAVYKVCGSTGCLSSDILAGINSAVEDGVDVISLSLGSDPMPYHVDPIAIGTFGAIEKGVVVSASAGNSGPLSNTVTNLAPWITTVGASTIDRKFPADLVLGDGRVITGSSLFEGEALPDGKYLPLIYAGNTLRRGDTTGMTTFASYCLPNELEARDLRGKIVVCDRGGGSRVGKGAAVKKAGGVGVIVANVAPLGEGVVADAFLIPGLGITESARTTVLEYINSTANPQATMRFNGTTLVQVKPAPLVAAFSSRGPNPMSTYVIKPDIIAPGVNILAAWPDDIPPTEISSDTRRTGFNIISGTSMSCPHVSGVAALLKGAHPDWSPAMIKSAMMTTAYTIDRDGNALLDEKDNNVSSAFEMGAGHVDPEIAVDPGLVYDLTVDDYLDFLCASNFTSTEIKVITQREVNCSGAQQVNPWDLNYPAISVSFNSFDLTSSPSKDEISVTVKRTVTHVSDCASSYTVKITNPKGTIVTVDHEKLEFRQKGEKLSYVVKILSGNKAVPRGDDVSEFGQLTWTDGTHQVTSPIVVTWS